MADYYCARCSERTSMYGHFTKHCRIAKSLVDEHFCCPDNCELENNLKTNIKQDWVETEHLVRIEQELIGQYSNEITLDDLIKAGIIALRAQNRIKFVESECIDGGF